MAAMFARLQEGASRRRERGRAGRDARPRYGFRCGTRAGAAVGGLLAGPRPLVGKGGPIKRVPAAAVALVCRAGVRRSEGVQRRRPKADRRSRRADRSARDEMRISVCRPQVPYRYGGAEVVADLLVDEFSGSAGTRSSPRSPFPYAWMAAPTCSDQAPDLAARSTWDQTPGEARPSLVIATKFPSYGIPPRETRSCGSSTSSGRPTTSTAAEFRQFSESPADRATKLGVERFDKVALGRGAEADLHDLRATSPTA